MTGTTKNCSNAMGKCQQTIKQSNGPGLHDTVMYHFRVTIEGRDQDRRRRIDQNPDQLRNGNGTEHAKPGTLFCPVILLRSQVLAHKGRQCHGKTGHRQKRKPFDLGIGTAASHGHFTESIDICLHKYIRNGDHRILKPGWHAILDDLTQHQPIKPDLLKLQTVLFLCPHQMDHAENGTGKLGNGGRQRC